MSRDHYIDQYRTSFTDTSRNLVLTEMPKKRHKPTSRRTTFQGAGHFRALHFREPGVNLFEIATDGPGFAADEPPETPSERLALPPSSREGMRRSKPISSRLPSAPASFVQPACA
jgi:hypothetical protein